MLTLQSYEQQNGFSVITADELYYVNGGSHPGIEAAGNYLITSGKNIVNPAAVCGAAGDVAAALGSTSSWTALGAFATLCGYGMQALGNAMIWIAKNDSGDVQSAMDRYYEHH